jgi:hypothetical protein
MQAGTASQEAGSAKCNDRGERDAAGLGVLGEAVPLRHLTGNAHQQAASPLVLR